MEVCENALQTLKNILFKNLIPVVWKYAQMHQNTFLTIPGIKKYLFLKLDSGGLEVSENAYKHFFNLLKS
jgi:hypothetical protein